MKTECFERVIEIDGPASLPHGRVSKEPVWLRKTEDEARPLSSMKTEESVTICPDPRFLQACKMKLGIMGQGLAYGV